MTHAWVIGSNGLLGSALVRQLRRTGCELYSPAFRFSWNDADRLQQQFAQCIKEFSDSITEKDSWHIYWAAGIGTFNSTENEMATETRTLSRLLDLIRHEPALNPEHGALAFSSSAGAIYAGSSEDIITENTAVAPTTAYAREKLKQEETLRSFSDDTGIAALLARISTLYGPGQASGKKQGLISHIARNIIRNRTIQIYVPLDTIRDYITADDAASLITLAMLHPDNTAAARVKIIASESPTTIAEIISVFKQITRRRPSIVTSASRLSGLYSRRILFRSVSNPVINTATKTSLTIGIAQVMSSEQQAFSSRSSLLAHKIK